MIFDTIERALPVAQLHPRFATALAWLREEAENAAPGRHVLDGDDVFVNVDDYETHPFDPAKFELHDRNVDIQYVARGEEDVWVGNPAAMRLAVPLDAAKDVSWHERAAKDGLHRVVLGAGCFLLLWPGVEAHQPGVTPSGAAAAVRVHKAIAKIRI